MFKVIAVLFLLAVNGTVMAGRWSVGGSLGLANGETDSAQINNDLMSRNINAQASDSDVSRMSQQLYLAYEFGSSWGVELGFVDLGDVEADIDGTIQGINDFLDQAEDIYPQTAKGWQLSGVYRYPISGQFQFMGKAGVFQWTSDYTLQIGNASQEINEDGLDYSLAIGLEAGRWVMQSGFVGLLNLELYQVDDEIINVISLGGAYRF